MTVAGAVGRPTRREGARRDRARTRAGGSDRDFGPHVPSLIAHDLNNLLTAILGLAQMTVESPNIPKEAQTDVAEIVRVARRAALLSRQLIAIGRFSADTRAAVDLGDLVASMSTSLRPLMGADVELRVSVPDKPVHVLTDPAAVEVAVLNLTLNGRDAMPDGGVLSIEVQASSGGLPAGPPAAVLSISDTGVGMDDSIRARAMEPYFTTKKRGHGSGLGLASVSALADRFAWRLSVESVPGRGSRFVLVMPRMASAGEVTAEPSTGAPRGHGERVLVDEPDRSVRRIVVRTLRRLGYSVTEAKGEERRIRDSAGRRRVEVVITELDRPQGDGRPTANALLAEHAGARLLILTSAPDPHRRADDPPTAFLAKPFSADELATAIRALLDEPIVAPAPGVEAATYVGAERPPVGYL